MNEAWQPFVMCYVFKGQSYSSQQRIRFFIEELQKDIDALQTFRDSYCLNKEIQIEYIHSLEPLIKKSLLITVFLLMRRFKFLSII
ncbi:MAG: hypothetical protein ACFE9X_01905 [Promethearchaeota archaeon]